jgi:hypothetical protein
VRTRTQRTGLRPVVMGVALALAVLGAAAPAGPAAALGRVCPPGAPNCDPERLPGGETGGSPSGYGGLGPARGGWPDGSTGNTNRRNCPPGQPSCGPET